MANPFDQFDTPAQPPQAAPAQATNPFDRFDESPSLLDRMAPPGGWKAGGERALQSLGDSGRTVGYLFGLGDRFAAGMDTLPVVGTGKNYTDNLADEQKATADAFELQGWQGTINNALGSAVGASAVLPESLVAGTGGIGTQMLKGAGGGALIGGVGGAAETPAGASWEDMGKNALVQGGVGAATGGVISPALSAGGLLIQRALAGSPVKTEIPGVSNAAVRFASGITDPAAAQQQLATLGPLGTLADVSPDWAGVAGGAAARPGTRSLVVDTLNNRASGANQRLGDDLNAALGPVTPPSTIQNTIEANRTAAGQQYAPLFQNATAVNTQPLADQLQTNAINLRGPAQRATQAVRNDLNIAGTDQLDPNPGTLFQTRQAIDGRLATEQDPKAIAALTNARAQVDTELQRAVPGIKPIDSQYAQIMGQRDGLQTGAAALDSGKTAVRPEDFAQQWQEAAAPTGQMTGPSAIPLRIQQGNRAEIDRVLGTNSNDPMAFNRLMRGEGDWNGQKLATMYGPDNAQAALDAGQREATFANTRNRTVNNSETAARTAFGDAMTDASKPMEVPKDLTAMGLIGSTLKKGLDAIRGNTSEAAAQRFAEQLGAASVAQGSARDRLIQALAQHQAIQSAPLSPGMSKIVNALVGTREDAAQRYLPLYGQPSPSQ